MALLYVLLAQITGAILFLSRGIECCDTVAISDCVTQYGTPGSDGSYNCDLAAFDSCITNAGGTASCTGNFEQLPQTVETIRELLGSEICSSLNTGDTDINTCLGYIQSCVGNAFGTTGGSFDRTTIQQMFIKNPTKYICLCENFSSDVNTCLEQSGFNDCPALIKASVETSLINATGAIDAVCASLGENACECAEKVDMCTNRYLKSNFRQTLGTNTAAFLEYPKCLELGSEQNFQLNSVCLEGLPEKCGLLNDSLLTRIEEGETPPYGYDVLYIGYSCAAGCASFEEFGDSVNACFSEDLDKTEQEFQDLNDQERAEYCEELNQSVDCVIKALGTCPRNARLFSEATELTPTEENGIPPEITRLGTCNITLPSFAEIVNANTSGFQRIQGDLLPAVLALLALLFLKLY